MPELELKNEIQEIWKLFRETDAKFKETERMIQESRKEAKERANSLENLFTGQWGKLIEALVKPGVLKLFKSRGIQVNQAHPNVESLRNGGKMEVDLLLTNDEEVIVIEVKTTLKVEHGLDHLERLNQFFLFFPRYKGCRVYGAVAGLKIEEESDRFAYRQGLFVLKVGTEDMIEIANDEKFRPKDFSLGML
ncbi:MAG TPA: DUF3782 domain-containing protein [Thermodesulfovibrionia bacterium]|nr:DUF3782 domain-containing protein [Thermodesulfovibrionia bacterium]